MDEFILLLQRGMKHNSKHPHENFQSVLTKLIVFRSELEINVTLHTCFSIPKKLTSNFPLVFKQ